MKEYEVWKVLIPWKAPNGTSGTVERTFPTKAMAEAYLRALRVRGKVVFNYGNL